jgi:hypothetical protein
MTYSKDWLKAEKSEEGWETSTTGQRPEAGNLEQGRKAGNSDCRWQTGSKGGDRVWPLRRDGGQSNHSTMDAWAQTREF